MQPREPLNLEKVKEHYLAVDDRDFSQGQSRDIYNFLEKIFQNAKLQRFSLAP